MESILGVLQGSEWLEIKLLADMVQESVDGGKWAYLAVLTVFIAIEANKKWLSQKVPSIKKNAAQYSAGLGALTGATLSDDKVNGALGGMLVGNAASGLYSSVLKPILQFSKFDVVGLLSLVFGLAGIAHKAIKKKSLDEKKKALSDFDEALKKTKGEDPSTKELEEWLSKHL